MKDKLKIKLYDDAGRTVADASGDIKTLGKKLTSWLEKFK